MKPYTLPEKAIQWLENHRLVNVALVALYFAFIIHMHHPLVLLSVWIEQSLTIEVYNLVVAVVFTCLLTAAIVALWFYLKDFHADRNRTLFFGFTTVALLITHSQFMLDSNIEVIHSLEFMWLTFLLFPFSRRYGAAIFFTLPFMLYDEWFQYILLYPDFNQYLDLNDGLMDTYGCAIMALLMMISGVKTNSAIPIFYKRPEFVGLMSLLLLILAAIGLQWISPYLNNSAFFVFNERTDSEPFWRYHDAHKIYYHVMKPMEGIAAIFILHLFYLFIDKRTD